MAIPCSACAGRAQATARNISVMNLKRFEDIDEILQQDKLI
jgi:hypothetical protein